ncbi:tripartite tricarboxylate transporter substrate binding protein [Candidimonas sp. SYP-B2681]|uniref:Bug family tripartite tricarboxylate transporter substrate binding protein n=1 Tax=Candidimonas sp. SYP-B2681 TaxID=2497686 RepID=UPI000F875EBE|nr:tripartite tricarboxylate transporter substrate binding protein [Candidimonas sp. SYP-B2681]RTZ45492.1 tripartite tricarboxylate transporter substrate binding protein [Candidimonas sp. SYP-B2681]
MKKFIRRTAVLSAALAFSATALAAYPDKPIKLLVHFPAGSSTDVIARTLAQGAGEVLGQPIVIHNKPGADGSIAAQEAQRSAPDGYTLFIATNSPMSGVPVIRKKAPYDPVNDFTPITDIGRYSFFLYTRAETPGNNLQEFVDYAKKNPGTLTYGSGNITGLLSFAHVANANKLEILNVPYKGEPPGITDMLGGHIDAMVATSGTGMPHVQTGKFKVHATVLPKRSLNAPDVPTMAEAGIENFPIAPWLGLFGPAGMPADVVAKVNEAFTKAMEDPKVKEFMTAQDFMLTPSTPEALSDLVKEQLESHRTLLRITNLAGTID